MILASLLLPLLLLRGRQPLALCSSCRGVECGLRGLGLCTRPLTQLLLLLLCRLGWQGGRLGWQGCSARSRN